MQICNQGKWHHLVGKFWTKAVSASLWSKLEPIECWIFLSTEFASFVAGEIIQVICRSNAWVRCASGNVFLKSHIPAPGARNPPIFLSAPLHQTPIFSIRRHFFFVSWFWPFFSFPIICIHIVYRFKGFQDWQVIFLDMVWLVLWFFFHFWWLENQPWHKKRWILNAFQWTGSLWNPSNFSVYWLFILRV